MSKVHVVRNICQQVILTLNFDDYTLGNIGRLVFVEDQGDRVIGGLFLACEGGVSHQS